MIKWLKKQYKDFLSFYILNNDPLEVGKVYQRRSNKSNPFERDCIYVYGCEKGWVKFKYITSHGLNYMRFSSETNKNMNMLYELTDYEYDVKNNEWIK